MTTWGYHHTEETKRKIGSSNSISLKGRKLTKEHKENIRSANIRLGKKPPVHMGADAHNWKGDSVGYSALHDWVERVKGKPSICVHCGSRDKRVYHWANKSGKYMRRINDWIRLCVSCHRNYDLGKWK